MLWWFPVWVLNGARLRSYPRPSTDGLQRRRNGDDEPADRGHTLCAGDIRDARPVVIRPRSGRWGRAAVPLAAAVDCDSVLSGSDETLKDIRPPADLSPPAWRQLAILAVAALAVVAALVAGSYLVHRRLKGRDERPASVAEARTPWEAAIQEIDRIERLDLPGEGRFKEHYTLVAAVTKDYVRYDVSGECKP